MREGNGFWAWFWFIAFLVAMIFNAAQAHADPYASPHCDPTARDYDSRMCSESPVNNPSCTQYGDTGQCMSDWLDFQRQQHQYYTSTPN